jgi:hypothetical protein
MMHMLSIRIKEKRWQDLSKIWIRFYIGFESSYHRKMLEDGYVPKTNIFYQAEGNYQADAGIDKLKVSETGLG